MGNVDIPGQAFQSLIGFKINWNTIAKKHLFGINLLFQSLIGFKINWNIFNFKPIRSKSMFQSLIGFKINWNKKRPIRIAGNHVSIPNRV